VGAEFGFEDFRTYLEEPIEENAKRKVGVTFPVNIILHGFILDNAGVLITDLKHGSDQSLI
jgi:hypothetical protein